MMSIDQPHHPLTNAYYLLSPSLQRAAALVIAAALLRAAPPGSLAGEPMALLATGLANESVRACDHPSVRAQLLAVVTNAVSGGGAACAPHSKDLFHVLLQLRSAQAEFVAAGGGEGGTAGFGGGLPPAETSGPARQGFT
jgi:dynein assembly factor 5